MKTENRPTPAAQRPPEPERTTWDVAQRGRRTYRASPSEIHAGTWIASYWKRVGGRLLAHRLPTREAARAVCEAHAGGPLDWVVTSATPEA